MQLLSCYNPLAVQAEEPMTVKEKDSATLALLFALEGAALKLPKYFHKEKVS